MQLQTNLLFSIFEEFVQVSLSHTKSGVYFHVRFQPLWQLFMIVSVVESGVCVSTDNITCVHAYMQNDMRTCNITCVHAYMQNDMRTCNITCVHAYMQCDMCTCIGRHH